MVKKLVEAFLLIIIFCGNTIRAHAQFEAVYIGVNGLTCSQCSRTVEMKIRRLDFVADVQMNLERTEGKILLKKDKKTDIEQIAQAVTDAGFSVRFLQADLNAGNIVVSGSCFNYNGDQYVFAKPPQPGLKGTTQLKFIGKRYGSGSKKDVLFPISNDCAPVSGKKYLVSLLGT